MKNEFLAEGKLIKSGIDPVDFNTADNTGARMALKNVDRVAFIVTLGAGSSTSAHSFALKQHDAASSGTTKELSVANPYYHKVGSADEFTKVEPTVAAHTYDLHSLLSNSKAVVILEVKAEDLDRANGFDWASLNVADVGGAQLGAQIIVAEPNFKPAYGQEI